MKFRPKILLVGNEADTLQLLEKALNLMGAEPCCLVSSREAASLLEREKFDGAFVDWDACDLDGEELTRRIRRSRANASIAIIMLSARTDTSAIAHGFEAGVTFFLSKPFGAKELERLLNVSRGTMLEEQRRSQRFPLTMPMTCEWGAEGARKRQTGNSKNMSTAGLLMTLFPQPELGTAMSVEILLPESPKSLVLKGVVTRTGAGSRVAIRFLQVSDKQRKLLETYVSHD